MFDYDATRKHMVIKPVKGAPVHRKITLWMCATFPEQSSAMRCALSALLPLV